MQKINDTKVRSGSNIGILKESQPSCGKYQVQICEVIKASINHKYHIIHFKMKDGPVDESIQSNSTNKRNIYYQDLNALPPCRGQPLRWHLIGQFQQMLHEHQSEPQGKSQNSQQHVSQQLSLQHVPLLELSSKHTK